MLPISNKKACEILDYRLLRSSFVGKRFEISNLDLIKDMSSIMKLVKILWSGYKIQEKV
jgi:hypothetical protein